jgi:3-phosphoshikimate 1-carboxyvinyltransferase
MHAAAQIDNDWDAPAAATAVHASIPLPGSKSITNRALILAALAAGPTTITGPLRARDTGLMAAALSALGATVQPGPAGPAAQPAPDGRPGGRDVWTVTPGWAREPASVDVGNAGTVLRFVPPVSALARADVRFSGDPRAAMRPVGQLLAGLRQLGVEIADDGRDAVPFTVRGRGRVRGGTVTLDASSSSQLVSGLMLAAPRYETGVHIRHEGERIPSAPHIAMTTAMLRAAGVSVEPERTGSPAGQGQPDSWRILPGPVAPGAIDVEPDLSNAAPFLAAALVTGGEVTIPGWPEQSLQAAGLMIAVLSEMGASITVSSAGLRIRGTGSIRGIRADLRDVAELTPVLTALAALADGPSEFTGVGHLRLHESDRLAALVTEIGALGGQVTELADGLAVQPRPLRAGAEPFNSYDDHRLVMAAAVLGLAVPGLRVRNAATVAKTFPDFARLWQQMLERPS